MSIAAMNVAWNTNVDSHTAKLVFVALADHADENGLCWPSIDTLARKCSLSRQGVLNQLQKLESGGHISGQRAHGRATRYTITAVNGVDPSTAQTRPPHGPVNGVDPSTAQTGPSSNGPVNAVDSPAATGQPDGRVPVNEVDPSTVQTGQPDGPPVVYGVDSHPSTALTPPVYGVDSNHKEPSFESSVEPKGEDLPKWRKLRREDADRASSHPLPTHWTERLRKAVSEFFAHRHDLATKPDQRSQTKEWTERMARSTVEQVNDALGEHGEASVLADIRNALAGGWHELYFGNAKTEQREPKYRWSGNLNSPDRYGRRDSGDLNPPGRYA